MVRFLNCIVLEDETNFRSNKWLNLTPASLLVGVERFQLYHVTPSSFLDYGNSSNSVCFATHESVSAAN